MEEEAGHRRGTERRWLRAAGLLGVTLFLSVGQPLVLVAVPLALLAIFDPRRNATAILVAVLAAAFILGGPVQRSLWYLERGWALLLGGWFVALTLRWPTISFTTRGLAAVAGAFLGTGLLFGFWPDGWAVADWAVSSRLMNGASSALEALKLLQGDGALSTTLVAAVYETAELQGRLFPALLGLSSMAGLGAAWWLHRRLVHGTDGALGALRDFRFSDQLVWVLIVGCLLLLLAEQDGLRRAGSNAVVFMGGLYVLRGAAVAVFLAGGVTLMGGLLAGLALVFLPPIVLGSALLVGLGDTWVDLRSRAEALGT